ncbi:YidC/Oxa1 family membrane protein insertase [Streptomyces sp. BE303]|uniref:YidC/Oxa1 family membrane protein insertase n=1 Tax=Streptomyces sp. BE303 TaxID=3002528 RepID=UPI002E77DA06|nr:YidC/Oxa1 family membrane protein insertase [Streptomyces sp. BE303]MED7954699.1 YidC/Oxa1 family membrane protein insertase [Streptomyces sp. BE303]
MSVFALLDPAVGLAHDVVAALAQVVPTALAIVLFTVCVRLALHPLARAAARGEQTRTRLAPQVAELNRRHKDRPEKLREALAALYAQEKSSPLAGCLPMLVQIPFFSVMYRLFTTPNDLLGHTLFGVPLGLHVGSAQGVAQWVVFGALYAGLAAVAYVGFRRARRAQAAQKEQQALQAEQARKARGGRAKGGAKGGPAAETALPQPALALLPYLSFGTVLFAALVPLAAGVYLLTTTAWSAAERAWLHRNAPVPVGAGVALV